MKPLLFLVAFLAVLLTSHAQPSAPRIAVVDLEGVLSSTGLGRAARSKYAALEAQHMGKVQAIESEVARLMKERDALPAGDIKRMQIDERIEFRRRDGQHAIGTAQEELARLEQRLLPPIEQEIRRVAIAYAKESGIDAVFTKQDAMLVFVSDRLDITAQIVQRVDQANPRK